MDDHQAEPLDEITEIVLPDVDSPYDEEFIKNLIRDYNIPADDVDALRQMLVLLAPWYKVCSDVAAMRREARKLAPRFRRLKRLVGQALDEWQRLKKARDEAALALCNFEGFDQYEGSAVEQSLGDILWLVAEYSEHYGYKAGNPGPRNGVDLDAFIGPVDTLFRFWTKRLKRTFNPTSPSPTIRFMQACLCMLDDRLTLANCETLCARKKPKASKTCASSCAQRASSIHAENEGFDPWD